MKKSLLAFLSILPVLFFASCASTTPTNTSFLSNPEQLQEDGKIRIYKSPKLATTKFKKAYIAPVTLQLEKESFSEKKRQEMIAYYEGELKTAFGARYALIDAPASDAYTVRSAITGLNGANVFANAVLSIVAVPLDNGGASAETEILAGRGKERLYAESRAIAGGVTGKGSLVSKTFGYLSSTSHTKAALKDVAQKLVEVLPQN